MVAWSARSALLLAAAALCMATPAAGQTGYALVLGTPDVSGMPIAPDGGQGTVAVPWELRCEGPVAPGVTPTATMQWNIASPEGLEVTGDMAHSAMRPDCPVQPATQGVASFQVQATPRAQAFIRHIISFEATLSSNGPSSPAGNHTPKGTAAAPVTVGFVGAYAVQVPQTITQNAPGSTTEVPVILHNMGNAAAVPRFAVDGIDVPLTFPSPEVLPAGAEATYTLRYEHPDTFGYDNQEQIVRVTITPVAVADETVEGTSREVNLLFRTRSFGGSEETPGPPLIFGIAALACMATLLRRVRGP